MEHNSFQVLKKVQVINTFKRIEVKKRNTLISFSYSLIMAEVILEVQGHRKAEKKVIAYADDVMIWEETQQDLKGELAKWARFFWKQGLDIYLERSIEDEQKQRTKQERDIGREGSRKSRQMSSITHQWERYRTKDMEERAVLQHGEGYKIPTEHRKRNQNNELYKVYYKLILTHGLETWA